MSQFKNSFDPGFSHKHESNRQAAKERGWRFDERRRVYVDEEGCIVADKFGQPI